MPRKLSDRKKKELGTYRPDRETEPKPVPEARAAATAAALELAEAERALSKRGLTPRQKRLAQDKIRVLSDNLEIAMEELAKAIAVPPPPSIRLGIAEMSSHEATYADPPLSDDEWLEWITPASKAR